MGECRLSGLLACPRHRPAELGNVTISFRSRKFRSGALGRMAVPETAVLGADKAGRWIWAPLGGLTCIIRFFYFDRIYHAFRCFISLHCRSGRIVHSLPSVCLLSSSSSSSFLSSSSSPFSSFSFFVITTPGS